MNIPPRQTAPSLVASDRGAFKSCQPQQLDISATSWIAWNDSSAAPRVRMGSPEAAGSSPLCAREAHTVFGAELCSLLQWEYWFYFVICVPK